MKKNTIHWIKGTVYVFVIVGAVVAWNVVSLIKLLNNDEQLQNFNLKIQSYQSEDAIEYENEISNMVKVVNEKRYVDLVESLTVYTSSMTDQNKKKTLDDSYRDIENLIINNMPVSEEKIETITSTEGIVFNKAVSFAGIRRISTILESLSLRAVENNEFQKASEHALRGLLLACALHKGWDGSPFAISTIVASSIENKGLNAIKTVVDSENVPESVLNTVGKSVEKIIAGRPDATVGIKGEQKVSDLYYQAFRKQRPIAMKLFDLYYGKPEEQYAELIEDAIKACRMENSRAMMHMEQMSEKIENSSLLVQVAFPMYTRLLANHRANLSRLQVVALTCLLKNSELTEEKLTEYSSLMKDPLSREPYVLIPERRIIVGTVPPANFVYFGKEISNYIALL